ncbi:RNA polymerase sigma-70 factor [Spirosoma sp. HMF3257]|uniref:RNA polymerase sigma-70 factor n=1 Tax=Spirosoma telluris TaxID=2183553 RepID=A0A327NTU0_9BACT|nr:RNA polymerase sigma-70 factor [Spirosoma telluris]RAI76168.1 RNA polymerase sigma-70 factor [Spirosoma telluris]
MDREYLIRQAFAIDTRRGYECLFRRYYKVLCTQAVRYTYSRDIAEDIVAEVFLGFWKNRVHEHITSSYRSYLYRAVRNRVYNHLQDEFRRDNSIGKPVDLDMAEEVNYEDPQRIIQFTELYQQLETEIKRLPRNVSGYFSSAASMAKRIGKLRMNYKFRLKVSKQTFSEPCSN